MMAVRKLKPVEANDGSYGGTVLAAFDELQRAQTSSRLIAILVGQLGVTADQIGPDVLLVPAHDDRGRKLPSDRADLGCDSLDVVEIVMSVEEEFSIEISDDDAETLNEATFAQLVDFVQARLEPAS